MNIRSMKGWKDVFVFTFRQVTKSKAFRLVTALSAVLIFALIVVLNILDARPNRKEAGEVTGETAGGEAAIQTVYVADESGFASADYELYIKASGNQAFEGIKFIYEDESSQKLTKQMAYSAAVKGENEIAVVIKKTTDGYQMEALIPAGKAGLEAQAEGLLSVMLPCFEGNKLTQAGLSEEQLSIVMMPVISTFSTVGESSNQIAVIIKMVAPMIFGLILYMMLIFHGQTISREVSTEKTSKLMESLLISVHPYAMITGKVLAISAVAVMQFAVWILSAAAGLYGGNAIAHSIYPSYQNSVIELIDFIKDNIGETAFSLPAVLLGILILCVGFLFYCVLAGLAGCMVIRPEDVASVGALFQFPIVISWLFAYFAPINGNEAVLSIIRYVPFTAPFCVPVELITGAMGLFEGVISAVILLVFSIAVISISARIYKGLVLYNGQKLNLKTIGKILKAQQ